jgi:hypothetical protein
LYFCIFKALFEKSKTEKSDEICKLANRNPTERNINVNYSTSAHNLVSSSFEVEQHPESASAHTLRFLIAKLVSVELKGCKQTAAHRRNRIRFMSFSSFSRRQHQILP